LSGRLDIWSSVSESLRHLPFFGYGTFRGTNTGETPHNVFLANLLFYGFPGFLSLLSLLGSGIYIIWRQVKREPSYGLLALFGFVLAYICAYSQIEFVLTCPHSFSNSVALLVFGFLIYLSTKKQKSMQDARDNESESEILSQAASNEPQPAVRT
jgi:O-antigen ligase